ncbi:M56 family metallopeptidase [Psychroflexus sediminis]|uniref:Signal transducer regulating beta-lactamase production, contains metallopeptidase domain n=1 Tax=Psychroflexus sediminis TaxID=470826 RepID=A0A1G7XZC4_9FLAO|nr:M56 family metallopeptidase [Psychroflexus sediminis]SDG89555.1 Signal transducer regulating beta-lactamase production, contains metallopeptidase domain [Psychroflexus sediminis]
MWWYLLDVILFQTCFLGLYLLFKTETFYAQNRAYLLVTAVLSFIVPLLDFSVLAIDFGPEETVNTVDTQFQSYFMTGKEVNLTASGANTEPQTSTWSMDAILKLIYLIGISFFAIKFSIGYWKLKQLTHKARFECYIHKVQCYKLEASENAFTFWKSIFVGDKIPETQRAKVVAHELEHARSNHALDLFFTEFLRMLFWLSPAHHWLKRELVLVHELQADAVAAKDLNKRDYAQSLLNQAFGTRNFEFSHSFFNHSQLKQRLMMLQKKNSRPQNLLKYLLILPLLGLMLTYTACKVSTQEEIQQLTEEAEAEKLRSQYMDELEEAVAKYGMFSDDIPAKFRLSTYREINSREDFYRRNVFMILMAEKMDEKSSDGNKMSMTDTDAFRKLKTQTYEDYLQEKENDWNVEVTETERAYDTTGDVPFAVIESVPVFPGCEGLATNQERKECMSKKISQFVNENFDTGLAKTLGLTGVNRVYVQFKIDKTGKIVDVRARAPHPDLQAEGERVISKLPEMQPGEQKGEKVGVLYSLPITFQTYGDSTEENENQAPMTKITKIKNTEAKLSDVPFAVIESVPVFPGCEGLGSNDERKECMSRKVSQFVNENFDIGLAKKLGLTGVNRVYVQFKIDKTGKIVDVRARAPHPDLQAEGERVIKELPKMKPGEHEGEKVGVLYAIPLTFNVPNE